MIRFEVVALGCALALAGCGDSKQAEEASAKSAQLAGDLVTCKNDLSSAKRTIAELQAELTALKAKAAADATVHVPGVELKAGGEAPKHMEGNIPPEKLSAVITRNSAGLRACYERALKHNPSLQMVSSVNLRFSVRNTGEAFDVSLSPRADAEMSSCMSQAVAKWKFPAFQGDPVQVETPVSLVAK